MYVKDYNDILIEYYIVRALIFNGGVSGTTAVLFDAGNLFSKSALKKTNFKIRTGAR